MEIKEYDFYLHDGRVVQPVFVLCTSIRAIVRDVLTDRRFGVLKADLQPLPADKAAALAAALAPVEASHA